MRLEVIRPRRDAVFVDFAKALPRASSLDAHIYGERGPDGQLLAMVPLGIEDEDLRALPSPRRAYERHTMPSSRIADFSKASGPAQNQNIM